MIPFIYNVQNRKTYINRKQMSGCLRVHVEAGRQGGESQRVQGFFMM